MHPTQYARKFPAHIFLFLVHLCPSLYVYITGAPTDDESPKGNTRSTISASKAANSQHQTMSTARRLRSLGIDNINPHVKEAKYAVRGELAIKAEEYRAKLAKGDTNLPFDKVISANIGNPQQLDQKPITFFRQVLSLVEHPPLLEHEDVLLNQLGYKPDALERARWLLKHARSVGAYSASTGVPAIRESVAKFIERMIRCLQLFVCSCTANKST